MKCSKHPRYTGKKAPNSPCTACWGIYLQALLQGKTTLGNTVSKTLKRELRVRRISKTELSYLLNTDGGTVTKLMEGKCGCSRATAERIADLCGVYGDDRLLLLHDATHRHRRDKLRAYPPDSDIGQAVIRLVLEQYWGTRLINHVED